MALTSQILKDLSLTDDDILSILLEERMIDACSLLRSLMRDKVWDINLLQARDIVIALKKEFKME